jgi:hypothetical protein
MSHHFDTPTAREDPRINVCDFYLFEGAPGATVMAMPLPLTPTVLTVLTRASASDSIRLP